MTKHFYVGLFFVCLASLLSTNSIANNFKLYPETSESFKNLSEKDNDYYFELADDLIAEFIQQPVGMYSRVDDFTLWRSYTGEFTRIWIETALTNEDMSKHLTADRWQNIPLPTEALKTMHLSPNTPAKRMSCFVGVLDSKPIYIFWSEQFNKAFFVVKLDT